MLETYFIYNLMLLISVVFALISEYTKKHRNIFIFFSFFSLLFFCAIRYDVGYDYDNYVSSFKEIYFNLNNNVINKSFWEDSFYNHVCRFFSFTRKGYLLVFLFYATITLVFLYKVLIRKNILSLGLFFFICLNFLFISFDQMRQFSAITIFMYSTKYIERKELKNYIKYILLASIFHVSALSLIPFYLIAKLEIKIRLGLGMLLIAVYGYFSGTWEELREGFYSLIPYYNFYLEYSNALESATLNSIFGVLYLLIISLISMYFAQKKQNKVLYFTSTFGIIIYLFASNNLNIYRISNFFLVFLCVSIPLLIKEKKRSFNIYTIFFISTAFIMFQLNIKNSPRGTSPYKTIFSSDSKKEIFRID